MFSFAVGLDKRCRADYCLDADAGMQRSAPKDGSKKDQLHAHLNETKAFGKTLFSFFCIILEGTANYASLPPAEGFGLWTIKKKSLVPVERSTTAN